MAYYGGRLSKEQRDAVAPALKELNKIIALQNSNSISAQMELTSMYFHGNVPRISSEPILSDYGLPDDIDRILEDEKKAHDNLCKNTAKRIKIISTIIALSLLLCVSIFMYFEVGLFYAILLSVCLIKFAIMIPNMIADHKEKTFKPTKSIYDDEYKKFLDDKKAYTYWKNMKSLKYWDKLDGHSFETAVARIYQSQGFDVIVSKAGGDGGIDLLLKRGNETIAVQCKAHNKAVAPAVARDLYGTMVSNNIPHGIIVSKNGFTKGVIDFTKDKDIDLVDLDMLLKMQESF